MPRRDDWALILGGAGCLWHDVAVVETMLGEHWPGVVIAVNDVGAVWARHLDHWATLHPEKLHITANRTTRHADPGGWAAERKRRGLSQDYEVWTTNVRKRQAPAVSRVIPDWANGSSGFFAIGVAYYLGCRKVVLAGVPMDERPHFAETLVHNPSIPWKAWNASRRAWKRGLPRVRERTRSLSGWTREQLGAPTLAWLHEDDGQAAA